MSRAHGNAHVRRLLSLVVVLMAMLFGASAWAAPEVRTGVTEVEEPEQLAEKPPPVTADARHQAPGDAPRLGAAHELTIPKPPASFNTHDAGWIRFAYLPAVRERVQPLIMEADSVRADLSARLGRPVLNDVTVYIARTPGEMATLAPEGAPFPKYAAGVAYSDIGLILLTIHPVNPNAQHDLAEVFRHELAHVALHDAVKGRAVPRWFNEGFAEFASGESSFPRLQTLWSATTSNQLLPLSRLERSFPADAVTASVAYAEAADVVRFLVRKQDQQRFVSMIGRVREGQSFNSSMQDAYGLDLASLEYEWREDVAKRYTFWPVLFGGSIVWVGAIGLFVWGWRRRRKRDKATLARWTKEEAMEDELRRRLREAEENGRVRIVFARAQNDAPDDLPPPLPEGEVPKIEHEGRWHTLH